MRAASEKVIRALVKDVGAHRDNIRELIHYLQIEDLGHRRSLYKSTRERKACAMSSKKDSTSVFTQEEG